MYVGVAGGQRQRFPRFTQTLTLSRTHLITYEYVADTMGPNTQQLTGIGSIPAVRVTHTGCVPRPVCVVELNRKARD